MKNATSDLLTDPFPYDVPWYAVLRMPRTMGANARMWPTLYFYLLLVKALPPQGMLWDWDVKTQQGLMKEVAGGATQGMIHLLGEIVTRMT